MSQLDFGKLDDHLAFQRLCGELLLAEGCCNLRGSGTGADQGADLLMDVPAETPLGRDLIPYVVQCKWYAQNRSVGADEVTEVAGFLSLHRASGLLIVTSGEFSGTAVTKADAIDRDPAHPYRLKLWNGAELNRRLRRYPGLIAKYWYKIPRERPSSEQVDSWPLFGLSELASTFGPPVRFAKLTIDSFRETTADPERIKLFQEFAARYEKRPPVLVIVTGAVGSGKTGFSWSLLNARRAAGALTAGLACYDVKRLVNSYVFEADDRLPRLIGALGAIDFLLLDDFGYSLGQRSDTHRLACKTLIEVIELRIKERRPTLLTVGPADRMPAMLMAYLEQLKKIYPTLDCGERSLVCSQGRIDNDADQSSFRSTYWLSKAWLSEKIETIERQLAECATLLAFPEMAFAQAQRLFEETDIYMTREEHVLALVRDASDLLRERREWIERLPWNAIRFEADKVELELD